VRDEARGLRVVEVDDVALRNGPSQLVGCLRQALLIDLVLRLAEGAAVAVGLMQPVVEPLGQLEELGAAADRKPAQVDPAPRP
jgi:hypothetical protein